MSICIESMSGSGMRARPWVDTAVARRGSRESCSHDSYDDGRKGAKGTQHILGSSVAATAVAIGGTRRIRAAGSTAGGAGTRASRTRGSGGIWVGSPQGLDLERLRTGIDLEQKCDGIRNQSGAMGDINHVYERRCC